MQKPPKPGQRAVVALREMIASGKLKPGERIAEIPTAHALGVSRMPVRVALRKLEQEGLVERCGARGYSARDLSSYRLEHALEVRGVLEGLAAGLAATHGLTPDEAAAIQACLKEGDDLFRQAELAEGAVDIYEEINDRFHRAVLAASRNPALEIALANNNLLPFAAPSALAVDVKDRQAVARRLFGPHQQHHMVFEAILRRDAQTAESLMRQHAMAVIEDETRRTAPALRQDVA